MPRSLELKLVVAALVISLLASSGFAQSCNASVNLDPAKTIVIKAWDGTGESTAMGMRRVFADRSS